jgi:CRP-like cAMP-binding protein
MNNKNKIADYIQRLVALSLEEALQFCASFQEMKIKKKQFLVQPNFIATHRYYVINGALISYIVNNTGQENTIALAVDDWWITDYNSYIYQQPATMFVMASQNTTVFRLAFEQEQALKNANPMFDRFFRIMAQRGLASQQRRLIINLTLSAEERYTHLVENYPQFLQHFPQYVLASYLGMNTEFLSKIRNNKTRRKS